MTTSVNTDDVIFNFFKQICDEKDDKKCVELGNEWIKAMESNLSMMEENLNGADKLKHKDDIQSNRDHLNSLKNKNSSEWREYATQCMIEIMKHSGLVDDEQIEKRIEVKKEKLMKWSLLFSED